jgi:AAA domain, putative AbiEii toxin, Type IV TA system
LPSIKWVSTPTVGQGLAGISVWSADPSTERDDLSVRLEDSGTGVGQVLAILYAAMESQDKKILVIDEPNSFLHPAASRKLVDILARYDHQYIISTHSPEIIARSSPDTLHVLRRDDNHSIVEVMDSSDVSSLKDMLSEVGVHLSDLFGPDAIIWVEGVTEEKCFPLLFEAAQSQLPRGASIVALLHTGDFQAKRAKAKLAFELYERLSHANALVPPALAFIFDREERSEQELNELERRGAGRVKLLPRMMYENYLIDPEAIAEVLCGEATEAILTEQKIAEWLRRNGGEARYFQQEWDGDIGGEEWLTNVNSAKLLSDMFAELTDARHIYRKTIHSVALTKWLLKHRPERLTGLLEFVRGIKLN